MREPPAAEVGAVEFSSSAPGNQLRADVFGCGSSPLLAAAAAWDGLAEELGSAAVSFGQVTPA
ncbi:PPE domain-containing protein [Mycobacterium tuberculosis]